MNKVAIIISNIQNRAGTERAVTNLANILSKYGNYKVDIISIESSNKKQPAFELDNTVSVINMNIAYETNTLKRIKRHIKTYVQLKQIILNNKYDILIGTEYYIIYLFTFIKTNIIKIGCEHTNYDKPGIHHKILRKVFYPKMNAIVMLTKRDTEKYYFIKNKYCIPNSISFETDNFAKYENKTFLACGRLTYQKGFDMLIKAAVSIKEKLPDWKINIYGNGEDKEALLTEIKENKLDDYIQINEPVNDIKTVYGDSSIYLLPSRFEGLPMVLLESQAAALPAVCFDCPEGPADVLVEDQNGFLIAINDINEFANKAIELAQNKELWKKMSENAKNLSQRFAPENIYKLWNKLFNELLNS